MHAPGILLSDAERRMVDFLEDAVTLKKIVSIDYADVEGRTTKRDVWPLGLWFWGKVWTFVAWCELRDDFRAFRIDRIRQADTVGRQFKAERGKTLADFYRRMETREECGN